jgi:hypothetical protein
MSTQVQTGIIEAEIRSERIVNQYGAPREIGEECREGFERTRMPFLQAGVESLAKVWSSLEDSNLSIVRQGVVMAQPAVSKLGDYSTPIITRLDQSMLTLHYDMLQQQFLQRRMDDVSNHLGRFVPDPSSFWGRGWDAVQWCSRPVTSYVPSVLQTVDQGVGSFYTSISQRLRSKDIPPTITVLKERFSELRTLTSETIVQLGLLAYARDLIDEAGSMIPSAAAKMKLEELEALVEPSLQKLNHVMEPVKEMVTTRLQDLATKSAQLGQAGLDKRNLLVSNMGDALTKTRVVTEHTISYLEPNNVRVIPRNLVHFIQQSAGLSERDEQFDALAQEFSSLFESILNMVTFNTPSPEARATAA